MAIYQYTAPDGNKYRVNAPEGATDQQVYGLVLQNFPYAGQTTKELEETKSAPSTFGDIARGGIGSFAGGLKSLTDVAGVDNPLSRGLGSIQQSNLENLSSARKEEMARQEELERRAESGTVGEQMGTGLRRFTQAPLQGTVNAIAGTLPLIGTALLPGGQAVAGASLGARALAGARGVAGIGGLMGLGGQKGQDYETVKQELLAQGVDPATAEQKAQEAAAYSLQNAPRQAAALGAGVLEGVFGFEQVLANAAKKVGASKGAASLTPPEFKQKLGAVASSTLGEALPEAVQATVGQVGTNIALNQAGVDKDLTEGLAGTVAHDALVGSVLGLAVSPLQVSNLQRQYKQSLADDQAKKQAEADAKVQAETQKAEAERAVLQKQTDEIRQRMEQQQAIALPAPSEEIPVEEVQTDPLKNPLGNIRKSEVPFDIYKQIDDYRKQAGLPRLKEYSIEDFVDAMPGQNPKAEQGLLDELITAKSGYAGEKYTAQDILNQAKLKNVDTTTKGFKDFLARTTGASALEQMSQPQLHAAFKSLNSLPASEGLNILPEGTNARRFDEKQYDKAIKGVDFLLAELGVPVDPKEVIKTIKEYTNLTEDSHAGAILDTAIKNGDVDLIKTPRYEIYDPKTGTVMPSTYTSRTAARAAAAKRGLNVRQITTDAIAAPATSATLPEGFDIREGAFKEGEAPAGYDVLAGDEVLFKANTVEEANAKKDSFERTRAGMANARENQVTQLNNSIEASQKRLNTMEAQGKGQTTGYQKAAGKHAKLVADTQAKIAALTEEIKKFDPKVTALAVKPTGNKAIGRKGYTVFEQGQARATYPSRQAAEESILAEMDEKQLQELTQQQGRRAIGKKAQAELERRTPKAPTAAEARKFAEQKPVSEVLKDIEEKQAKAEAPKVTPGAKERTEQFEALLKPILKQFGLKDVGLNIAEDLPGEGSYLQNLIKIALSTKEPVRVLRHESIHALKELGFFTPQQWSALERMAKDQWIDKYLKSGKATLDGKSMSRYDAYVKLYKGDKDMILEEAIADAFADFANNKPPAGMLAALLKRLNDFFAALRNALAGAGFQTYEDIFGKVERGELKAGKATKSGERFSLFPDGAPLSTRVVMEDDDTAARTALGLNTTAKRGRYNNVRDIARALNNDTLTKYGAMDRKQLTDDDVVKIANAMADEVSYQLGTTSETGTGLGWYSNNYPKAVKRLQSRFPELADNKHARSVFSAIVAVTSNGEKVTKNIANAVELYSKLREGKTMVAMGNRRATALENNLRQIERLLEDHKTDFEKHLLQEITVKDMNAYLREMGEKSDGSYLANTVVPRAAIYFGPKLGAFYANLSGSEGYLTMDLWWTRSVNRMRGLLIPKATEASIEKFRDMMGQPEADRDEVAAAAIPLRNKYKEYGFTTELEHLTGGKEPSTKANKPAWFKRAEKAAGDAYEQLLFDHNLEKMANTIYKNEYEMLEEAPFTATDRAFMYKAARNAQKTLRKSGIDLTLADIQAALWYYEKRLYGKLSGVKADDIGYEEAIIAQASEGGGRARPSVVFGRGSDGGTDTGRAVQRAEEAGRKPADGERLSLREAPDTPEFKRWSGGNPVIPASDTSKYKGGSAVFQAFHGSTYGGITVFDTSRGNEEGSLGAGSYFSTSAEDASENYAGVGPDLKSRTGLLSYNLKDEFLDDFENSKYKLQEYLDDKKIGVNVDELSFDAPRNSKYHPYKHFEAASDYLAEKHLKGDTDGVVMPVYVKLDKPFDMTSNRIELMYDEATEGSPVDDLNRFVEAVRDNAAEWGVDPDYYLTAVYDAALDGVTAKELWDMATSRLEAWDNPYTGERSSPSQFMQGVLKELGYDGIIQNASEVHGTMVGVERSKDPKANRTFHVMPFSAAQVKSATGNIGTYDPKNPDIRYSLRPFDPKELPQNKKEYTLPANTVLYHGAHEARAKDIEKAGKTLISRSPIKTSGGATDEGGLIYFGGKDTAQHYATKGDAGAARFAEESGEKRKPGQVFQTITDRPYRLMNKDYVLTQKEADALNDVLGIPDYKLLRKKDTANTAALRAVTNSRTVDRYKTDKGEMVVAWPKIFDTLGYDGFYDEFAVVLPADTGIRLVGKEGKMERFSLKQVDDFFNKADGIKEPEGVEIIRENWIGSVSGLGDRDSAYDLYRVQGGKKYIDDVQKLVRDELGESFKGYRLMNVEELEEIKAGAMGSQLASFTLRPDIAHAFANLASYRKVPKDQLRVVEMDLTPEHVVMVGHHGERELVVDYGQGYNPDAVVETSVGSYEQYNPTERLSLRDSTDPDTLARVNETTTTREEKGYVERITQALGGDTFSQLRAQALNRYNRLSDVDKAVVKKRGGAALMADESAEAGALQSDLAAGVTASALGVHDRNGGIPIFVNGVTKVFNDGGKIKGPVAIFAPLSKYNDPLIYQLYQFWAAAQRGSRLNEQGKPDIFTDDDLKRAEQLERDHPEFRQIQEEWTVFNNGLVQYLVDTGVLSEGDKARFTEFSDYIPFYRQMEGEKTIGPNLFQSISGVKKPKKLTEGTDKAPLADFLETIVRNTQSSIQMGMKNVAAQRAIDRALEIEMAEKLPPNAKAGLDTVQVLEKGQVVTYQVADHLFIDAVKSLNMPELPFIGLLSGPANFLRNMVTKDPGFMLANMVRDSMAAYVTSGVKMTPLVDTMSNFGKAMAGTSPEFEALLNAGIGGGYEFSQNIETSGKAFEKELKKKYEGKTLFQRILNPMTAPTSLWEALEKGTTASDMATRIEVYKRTLAETNNEAEALHRALEVMNFNRKGSSLVIRVLTAAIPFLNARMQGLDVLYRASFGEMNNKDAAMIQKRFIVRGLTMAALSAMYWTLTHDDEEYKKQEQETKDNNWLVPSLGIKIPIPFEIGVIFKVIPERIMALTLGQDTNKDFMDSMARNLRSTLAIDYLPQAIKPFVETESNFSLFTRRPIVGQGLEGVAPEFQIGPGTSSLATFVGSNLGMSPMKVDHLIGGYTGTMGMYMVSALDGIMNMNAENPNASKRFEQLPFIKRFALDPEARGTVTGYYELKNATDEVVRTSSLLERTMNFEERGKFMQENIKMIANKDYILDLEKTMKEFRQMQVMIRSSRMDADAKREALLRINQAQNALTANINTIKANVM